MPVRDEVEALVSRIILQAHPILEGAKIMADVEASCWAHPAQNSTFLRFSPCCRHHALLIPIRNSKTPAKRDFSLRTPTGSQERTGEKSRPAPLEMTGFVIVFHASPSAVGC